MNSDHLEKRKILHATSVAILARPNLPEKLNGEHREKTNIKTVMAYILMLNYSLFGEFQIVEPNLAKRKHDKNFKK